MLRTRISHEHRRFRGARVPAGLGDPPGHSALVSPATAAGIRGRPGAARLRGNRRYVRSCGPVPWRLDTAAANVQHYEVPAEFFRQVLGPRLKYSCCLYPTGSESLAEAEEAMLTADLPAGRAERRHGHSGTGLRLGIADIVDGPAIPAQPDYGRLELARPTRSTSRRVPRAGAVHVRVQTADMRAFDTPDRIRSRRIGGDVRTHAQLRSCCWATSPAGCVTTGSCSSTSSATARPATCSRRRGRPTGWADTSSRAA